MKNQAALLLIPLSLAVGPAKAQGEYFFDDSLLKGWGLRQDQIARYTKSGNFDPGTYEVEVFVNGQHRSRIPVQFIDNEVTERLEPCFTPEQLVKTLKSRWEDKKKVEGSDQCLSLEQALPGASYQAQLNKLQLHVNIPMALLIPERDGEVDPSEWDQGETGLFANYDLNWYQSKYRNGFNATSDYGFASLNAGFNMGLWRVRHQSTFNHSQFGGRTTSKWNNLRTYVQRSLPDWRSELTLGESFTTGQLFGGMSYRGVNLKSDQRMLPPSQRYYAPEVRGTATTTARVIIRQRGVIIRELTVPPGPFIVDDLQSTSYSGDLDVEIVEANGSVTRYVVPFSAVPQSMRPGLSQYSLTVGQSTQYDHPWFAEATYQRGVSNNFTANLGSRLAQDYLSLLAGGVVAGRYGALGLNFTSSHARVENGERKNGWRLGADYSQTFAGTNTTLTLAGYRYSSAGYRELNDVLGIRYAEGRYGSWNSYSYQQRAQYSLMLNQNFGRYGSLYFSGSTSNYYQRKQKDTQFQLGYTNNWKSMNYTVAWSYHKNSYYQTYNDFTGASQISNVQKGNVISVSLSFPLGRGAKAPSMNSTYTSSSGEHRRSNTLQTGVTGSFGDNNAYSYALSASKDSELNGASWNGSLQRQGPLASMTAGYGQSSDYRQYNAGIRGSMLLHKGGLTLGPSLGDTFGLVYAEGAEGAQIRHGHTTRINSQGYAIVPALSPYRSNTISIDPQNLPASTELLETEKRVVPYAGAIVSMSFATRFGQAILIEATQESGQPIPMGALVSTADDAEIGVVGQGGQVYARVSSKSGTLTVRWGSANVDTCVLSYDISDADWNQDLVKRKDICRRADAPMH